jgi:hypothetical protein
MKTKYIFPLVLAFGILAPAALAQSQQSPVLVLNIVSLEVTNGQIVSLTFTNFGSGYTANPTVTLSGGGGSGAMVTAVQTGGAITSYSIVAGGSGYLGPPTVTFSGGQAAGQPTPTQAVATAVIGGQNYVAPFQNEIYGIPNFPIIFGALASGTLPLAGFTYQFTVNGFSIGETMPEPPGTIGYGIFTPPEPGIYSIVATTSDGNGNSATSSAVRYFATGTIIASPEASSYPPGNTGQNSAGPGSLVPVGSSIVIQAVSQPADGFVSRVDFYTNWNYVSDTPGTLIGSSSSYPYSIIYTPAGPAGTTHVVKALAYDNLGALVPDGAPVGGPYLDQLNLTMTTPNAATLPSCNIVTPGNATLIPIPDYGASSSSGIPVIVTAGPAPTAKINKVELYINGTLYATQTTYPYQFNWQPSVTGVYNLVALAYDDLGNVIASTTSLAPSATPAPTQVTVEGLPAVAITSPASGGTVNSGSPTQITATASDIDLSPSGAVATITQVQFFQDGNFVGVATAPSSGNTYTITFSPSQKIVNGVPVVSTLTAVATDSLGYTGTSPAVSVNVASGGSSSNVIVGTPPTISLLTPVSQQNIVVNTPVTLSATATAPNGNIVSVQFFVDNKPLTPTVMQYPYTLSWTPTNLGFYTISAAVTDNLGDKVNSQASGQMITVNVVPEPPPTVSVTAPSTGSIVPVGSSVTVNGSASSPNGTIQNVQFFQNGISIGTSSAPPYTASFTPTSTGIYSLTAVATDNSGETNTSSPVVFLVTPATAGLGTVEYFGNYQGINGDTGTFAFSIVDGSVGTFIGHSTNGISQASAIAYDPDLAVSSAGGFAATAVNKVVPVSGNASATGVTGTLNPGSDTFIGTLTQAGTVAVASGLYSGSFIGQSASAVTAIVGADGEIMVYVSEGSYTDVGNSTVDSTGHFSITTAAGNTVAGTLNSSTGFMKGTLAGGPGGSFTAALVSGGTFSDGVLSNLSTRGTVGTGANIMIAGFAVGGTVPKQLMIRAVGPALTSFGISGALVATQLNVFGSASSTVPIYSNSGWSTNAAQINAADTATGAFALAAGSSDSALVGTFAPGVYTAAVSGAVVADTGVALVEVYDLDTPTPFTTKKLVDVSTRLNVGTGNAVAIAGFKITGSASKRLLIRGAGPGLTGLGVTGALSAPHLQLMDSSGNLIRENYSWQAGNGTALVDAAEAQTGAFVFAPGSADSALLIVLPPGTYTAELSGTGTATGVGLVEVYEVP